MRAVDASDIGTGQARTVKSHLTGDGRDDWTGAVKLQTGSSLGGKRA